MEVGINVEGGIFWKKLVHKSNNRGVEGGKSKISINVEDRFLFCGGWNLLKSVSVGSTFIREMRVDKVVFGISFMIQSHAESMK